MVSEVDALYAETRAETGLVSMSPAVRAALGKVERHRLVPASQVPLAYRNHPLPIGSGQTISQPYIVALSADLLKADSNSVVLDVGTGSGYQAAVLAEIVKQVYSIEIVETLGKTAAARAAGTRRAAQAGRQDGDPGRRRRYPVSEARHQARRRRLRRAQRAACTLRAARPRQVSCRLSATM